jgi:[ribosomal protein S5]-alanine N-acetyltransferase
MLTERLELIAATPYLCEAEARGAEALGQALAVRVPPSWPPPVFEPNDVERIRRQLELDPGNQAWTLHYIILRTPGADALRELVGVAGYAGPPSADGAVEVGYAIAVEHQRQGYATEAVRALVTEAFQDPEIVVVRAMTYQSLEPSIGVLRKSGFLPVDRNPATGLLRYERRRAIEGQASWS